LVALDYVSERKWENFHAGTNWVLIHETGQSGRGEAGGRRNIGEGNSRSSSKKSDNEHVPQDARKQHKPRDWWYLLIGRKRKTREGKG